MPSEHRQKKAPHGASKSAGSRSKAVPKKKPAAPAKLAAKTVTKPPAPKGKAPPKSPAKPKASPPTAPAPPLEFPLPGGRRHVLSLSFVRDGDEFLARLETDGGHITELKNRSLDQLLTLVASELEDLLE